MLCWRFELRFWLEVLVGDCCNGWCLGVKELGRVLMVLF